MNAPILTLNFLIILSRGLKFIYRRNSNKFYLYFNYQENIGQKCKIMNVKNNGHYIKSDFF